jgi:hypothetical protein
LHQQRWILHSVEGSSLICGLLIHNLIFSTISGAEGPDRVFVGGLPYYFTEIQIRELLESFGYEALPNLSFINNFLATVVFFVFLAPRIH